MKRSATGAAVVGTVTAAAKPSAAKKQKVAGVNAPVVKKAVGLPAAATMMMTAQTATVTASAPVAASAAANSIYRSSFLVDGFPYAIPFITQDAFDAGGAFRITPEARQFLASDVIRWKKLRIAVVAGVYRSGKSAILNFLVRAGLVAAVDSAPPAAVFGVGNTNRAKTKGLWLSTVVTAMPDDSVLLWMDVEGLGAIDATATNDARIFCIAMLVSCLLIYNAFGAIEKRTVEELVMATSICRSVRLRAAVESESKEADDKDIPDFMPDFMWLARDAHVMIVNKHDQPCSADDWLTEALQEQDKDLCFRRRSCRRLVRPCTDEAQLHLLETLPLSALRPEFQEQFGQLYQHIISSIGVKTVGNVKITGEALPLLMDGYLQAINTGAAPVIMNHVALLSETYCRQALTLAVEKYTEQMDAWRAQLPMDDPAGGVALFPPEHLTVESKDRWKPAARKLFKHGAFGATTDAFALQLENQMSALEDGAQKANAQRIDEQLKELWQGLAAAASKFANLNTLHDQYQNAKKNYIAQVGSGDLVSLLWHRQLDTKLFEWAQAVMQTLETRLLAAETALRQCQDALTQSVEQAVRDGKRLTDQLQELQERLVAQTNAAEKRVAHCEEEAKHELDVCRATHAEYVSAVDKMQSEWSVQMQDQRAVLQKQLDSVQEQLKAKLVEQSTAVARMAVFEARDTQHGLDLAQWEQVTAGLRYELTQAKSQETAVEELVKQKTGLQAELVDLKQQHELAKQAFGQELQSVQTQSVARVNALRKQLEAAANDKVATTADLESALATARATGTKLQERVTSLEAVNRELQDKAVMSSTEAERTKNTLERQLTSARQDMKDQADQMLKQLSSFHDRQNEAVVREMGKSQEAATQIAQLQVQYERLVSERNDLRRQLDDQGPVLAGAVSVREQREKISFDLRQAQLRVELMAKQLQDGKDEVAVLRERVIALVQQCTEAQVRAQTATMFASFMDGGSSPGASSNSSVSSCLKQLPSVDPKVSTNNSASTPMSSSSSSVIVPVKGRFGFNPLS